MGTQQAWWRCGLLIAALGWYAGTAQAAAQFTTLHSFVGSDGNHPYGDVTLSGTSLYGMTSAGGISNRGVVFQLNTISTNYTTLHTFTSTNTDGNAPGGSLTLAGATLYGMTLNGGTYNGGTLFQCTTGGASYSLLHSFAGAEGVAPEASLILSGATLYGTTSSGGGNGYGAVFAVTTSGMINPLHSFTGASGGGTPYGSLTIAGSTLYGMTAYCGVSNKGTIFRLNSDGSGYNVLHAFTGTDGSFPYGALTLSADSATLYGMTSGGGTNGDGTVFAITTNGAFSLLHTFTGSGSDGAEPYGSLTRTGSTLFGMTWGGGTYGFGTVFQIHADGTGYTTLYSFTGGLDGYFPEGSLTLSTNGLTLYGMALYGGSGGDGTVFAFAPPAVLVTASAGPGGTALGSGTNVVGNILPLTAVASNGWLFSQWNDGSTNNPYSIVVPPTDISYTASFARAATVTVLLNTNVAGTVTGGGTFFIGSNDVLTATPNGNWLFIQWNDGSTNNPYTITVPPTNITYTANFAAVGTISVGANTNAGGTLSGGGSFFVGTTDLVSAVQASGWQFVRWSDGDTNNPRTVVVAFGNKSYNAVFSAVAGVTAVSSPTAGGSVTGSGTYFVGSNIVLTALAANNWRFMNWNDGVTDNPRTVVVRSGGATYAANFSPVGTVVVGANPPDGGSLTGAGQYLIGSNATVTATASNQWRFINWNGSLTNNPWVFPVTNTANSCLANFVRISTVSAVPMPADGGVLTGSGTYVVGTNVQLTAQPAIGWLFMGWSDAGSTNPTRTISVPSNNVTYSALFMNPAISAAFGRALNATGFVWQTGGDANWSTTAAAARDGLAAQSGTLTTGGLQSWLETRTNGPASLTFWWKLSSEIGDTLQFSVNGQPQAQLVTSAGWQQSAVFLGSTNVYSLRWTLIKNAYSLAGSNAGWLDQVALLPCPYATNAPQLFYQDPSGMLASWVLNSTGAVRFSRILANTGGWLLKAAGDVTGDGVSDLLFQTASGETCVWIMNADGSTREVRSWPNLGGWEIKACGDYEGTHSAQLFFQTAHGDVAYWRLDTNGISQSSVSLGNCGGWKLRGIGDLDGDHKAELLWQNAAGLVAVWYHNPDGSIRGVTPFATGGWGLCGVMAMDLDGVNDLFWQTADGNTAGWIMNSNGTARAGCSWGNTSTWKLKAAGR